LFIDSIFLLRDSDERFKAFCEIAKTRSVLSVGISVFQKKAKNGNDVKNNSDFLVQTFNVMLLRKDSFMVEPASLKFLLEHGFDFNTHYAKAIPYSTPQIKVSIVLFEYRRFDQLIRSYFCYNCYRFMKRLCCQNFTQ
jgi:hypothetical protein